MFEIKNKQVLANNVKRIDVFAPNIAAKVQPGQFVSICTEQGDERIPLTVVEADQTKQTVALIFQEVGKTTKKLGALAINESIFSILGPLGNPPKIEKFGTVVCVVTGVGPAQILPICRALREAGNKVIGIIGAKTKRSLMLEAQFRLSCNKMYIATNDGSYERRAMATDIFEKILNEQKIDKVYAIGSIEMMETVCTLTKKKKVPTDVHLNPVMIDCMGMCGSCRVKIGNQIVLACLEGPVFNGHKVDFEDFKIRMKAFEELDQWHSQKLEPLREKSGSGRLTKFLSDILRN